jgi:mono/diheme cytochrome c family protein/glucose/arabinose dehydrogenase
MICGLLISANLVLAQQGDRRGESQIARMPREKIPPAPPLAPETAITTFRVQPGFHIEPVAAEPMIENPVVLQFDPAGRAWVVEMRGYMPDADGHGEDQRVGQISILEDTDGDGRMDKKIVFVDGLFMPRALLLVNGGVLICEPPALWFYPNHNDTAGPRVLVADDFAPEGDPRRGPATIVEHTGNSLVRNLDNWIYSLYHPYRYRQIDGKWVREAMPKRAQWGLSQDDFGRLFYSVNSDHLRGDMVPSHYFGNAPEKGKPPGIGLQIASDQSVWPIRVNPGVNRGYQPDALRPDGTLARFTAACGACIYRGDLFGAEYYGNAFVCDPAGNLVRRSVLSETNGCVTARNAYDTAEFLASSDELFRPVNLCNGPDGALYIVDMYHGIIQHRPYVTSYLRAQVEERGLDKVIHRGRMWRVVPDGKTSVLKTNLSLASSRELVGVLDHPNGWWRDTAQRLLVERNDVSIVPLLEKLASGAANPVTRLHALWSLEGMGRLSANLIQAGLDDAHPKVRAAAIRLGEKVLTGGGGSSNCAALRDRILDLAADAAPEVQIQLGLTLGLLASDKKAEETLSTLSTNSPVPLAREAAAFTIARHDTPAVSTNVAVTANAAPLTAAQKKRYEEGRTLFEATCLACHQQHGLGQPGLAPALVGSEWVAGSDKRLIRIVINGLRGPIRVKGETFELEMPALGILEDEQIASVLTYVRREWGHAFDAVEPATVKAVREETAQREDAWTMADLLKVP